MTLDPRTRAAILTPSPLSEHLRACGILSPAEYAEVERLRKSRYFLVLNNGPHGERLRCGRCNGLHAYFTLMCIERPFRGIDEALHAVLRVGDGTGRSDWKVYNDLRAAYARLEGTHPQTARALRSGLDASMGLDFFALGIGIAEPISVEVARKYADKIRAVDPTFVID